MSMNTPAARQHLQTLRDLHLADQAQAELLSLPYGSLRQVQCRVQDYHVVLTGTVPSFYQKQLAQEHLQKCLGAEVRISNELHVFRNDLRSE